MILFDLNIANLERQNGNLSQSLKIQLNPVYVTRRELNGDKNSEVPLNSWHMPIFEIL